MTAFENQPAVESKPGPGVRAGRAPGPGPAAAADVPADDSLRRFLASSDTPCPACGYNLRGLNVARCPECSTPLELTVASARTNRYAWAFLVLAFGWVFAAGAMNGWRQFSYAVAQARVFTQTLVSSNFSINASSGVVAFDAYGGSPSSPAFRSATPSFTVSGGNVTVFTGPPRTASPGSTAATLGSAPGAGNAGAPPPVARGATAVTAPTLLGSVPLRSSVVIASPGSATFNWLSVSSSTWLNLAWWGSLCLLSAAALVALAMRRAFRRRSGSAAVLSPAALRWYTRIALSLFALYAGYHIVNFTREITGL